MSHAGPPTGVRISVLALSMALPVVSVSPLLVHPRSAQSLPWRRARGRQKTPSEKNTDAVSSLLAAYPPLANVTAEADMLRTGGGLCATGLARRGVCCAATCATCGGRGCGRPANASGVCCKSSIVAERRPPSRAGARDGRYAQVRSRRRCEQPGDVACVLPEARAEIVDDDVDDGIFAPPNASSSPSLSNNYFVVVSTQHAGARWIAAELAARQCVTAGGEFFAARDAFHWTARAQRRALAALFSGAGAVDEASPKFAQWVEAVADPRRRRHFYTRDDDSAPPRRRSTVVATDKCARSASGGCSRNASPRHSTRGSHGLPPRAASGSSSWGVRTSCASPSPNATRAAASVAGWQRPGARPLSGARRRTDPGP